MENLDIINIQFGVFFRDRLARPDEHATGLNAKCGRIFNAIPTIIPVPEEAPPEIPIVIMNSSDNKYNANIGRWRSDLFINPNVRYENNFLDPYRELITNFLTYYIGDSLLHIKRVAFVLKCFLKTEEPLNVLLPLLDQRLRKLQNGDHFASTLQYTTIETIEDMRTNNYMLMQNLENRGSKGVLLIRDFNTVPTENYSPITVEKCLRFMAESVRLSSINEFVSLLCPQTQEVRE